MSLRPGVKKENAALGLTCLEIVNILESQEIHMSSLNNISLYLTFLKSVFLWFSKIYSALNYHICFRRLPFSLRTTYP